MCSNIKLLHNPFSIFFPYFHSDAEIFHFFIYLLLIVFSFEALLLTLFRAAGLPLTTVSILNFLSAQNRLSYIFLISIASLISFHLMELLYMEYAMISVRHYFMFFYFIPIFHLQTLTYKCTYLASLSRSTFCFGSYLLQLYSSQNLMMNFDLVNTHFKFFNLNFKIIPAYCYAQFS